MSLLLLLYWKNEDNIISDANVDNFTFEKRETYLTVIPRGYRDE